MYPIFINESHTQDSVLSRHLSQGRGVAWRLPTLVFRLPQPAHHRATHTLRHLGLLPSTRYNGWIVTFVSPNSYRRLGLRVDYTPPFLYELRSPEVPLLVPASSNRQPSFNTGIAADLTNSVESNSFIGGEREIRTPNTGLTVLRFSRALHTPNVRLSTTPVS